MKALIDIGSYTLDVTVEDDVDFDTRFAATDNDTGERLWINGWLIDSVEPIEVPLVDVTHANGGVWA